MEAFSLCLEIIKREGEKFKVGIDGTTASQITTTTATDVNYDVAQNRCCYLYRCGPVNFSFAKECFSKFFSSNTVAGHPLSSWTLNSNLTLCSLSKGPALDCIAFLQSFQEHYKFSLSFKSIKLISKHGAWRNTVNILHEMITEEGYVLSIPQSFGNIKVIQGDPFVKLTEKLKKPINESDVVIMTKTLNLQAGGYNPQKIISLVKAFLAALKEDAILFCIDTKPSIALITEAISTFNGKMLFQPIFINTMIELEHIDLYKTIYSCPPILSARGSFLVWQKKSPSLSPPFNLAVDRLPESIQTQLKDDNDSGYCDKVPKINWDSRKLQNDAIYCSTPTSSTQDKSEVFPSIGSLKHVADQLFQDCVDIASENAESFISASSYMNGCKHDSDSAGALSTYVGTADKSMQTAPENSFDNCESVKIAALTEKISNLTHSLKRLLETNEVNDVRLHCQSCLKPRNRAASDSVGSQFSCENCTSETLLSTKCSNESLHNSCNYLEEKAMEHCSYHLQNQRSLLGNRYCSNASLSDLENNEDYNRSFNTVKISAEQKTVPKLVIPLNNLSGEVIAQIVSLISESNQNS